MLIPGAPSQTWVFDGAARRWRQLFPATSPALLGARLALDAARGEIVAIGSQEDPDNCSTGSSGETWLWDGTTWRQAHPVAAPDECATVGATGMTYDAARRQVLLVADNSLSETWLWNGVTWTDAGAAPSEPTTAYDPISRRVIAFGGYFFWHGDNFYGDTSAWNGTKWVGLDAGGEPRDPQPRAFASMTYDSVVGALVMFGGLGPVYPTASPYPTKHRLSDTWRWVGTHWVRMGTATSPPPTAGASFVYDTKDRAGILAPGGGTTWLFTAAAAGRGYFLAETNGTVVAFGNAVQVGDAHTLHLHQPIVGLARTVTRKGYWLAATDGGVFSYGDAPYYGSAGGMHLDQPIAAIAATPSGHGYWLVAHDGGVFTFGDAGFFGSTGGTHLNQPIVAFAPTPTGDGYWLVARDGGVFCFGDAHFYGSAAATHLNQPVSGIAATPRGNGYWLVTRDGGVFSYGGAPFEGATPSAQPVIAIASSPTGRGYTTFDAAGGAHFTGDAANHGQMRTTPRHTDVVAAATT